jgi:hypothetical protein
MTVSLLLIRAGLLPADDRGGCHGLAYSMIKYDLPILNAFVHSA